jgi:hypothetical protein
MHYFIFSIVIGAGGGKKKTSTSATIQKHNGLMD